MYVSLPPRTGAYGTLKYSNDESAHHLSTSINGDRTLNNSTASHRVGRGLSWREANERARILFYRGKHPAIHYDEQAAGFDVACVGLLFVCVCTSLWIPYFSLPVEDQFLLWLIFLYCCSFVG